VPSVAEMRATVEKYLALVATGTAEEITALYAEGATLEDPVGADPLVGLDAVLAFYKVIEPIERSTELMFFKAAGDTAVFQFTIVTTFGDTSIEIQPADIMRFDEAGKIVSMRAVWAQDEMRTRSTNKP
jgi:steroid delta-isomerase